MKNLVRKLQCNAVNYTIIPFVHISTCTCSLQSVISLVRGLWFLLHYRFWAITKTPLGYPVVALYYGDPASLGLRVRFFHLLQKIIDKVDDGLSHIITLDLGL